MLLCCEQLVRSITPLSLLLPVLILPKHDLLFLIRIISRCQLFVSLRVLCREWSWFGTALHFLEVTKMFQIGLGDIMRFLSLFLIKAEVSCLVWLCFFCRDLLKDKSPSSFGACLVAHKQCVISISC